MQHFQLTGPAAAPEDSLTEREKEVLALISRGMRNVDVSEQLSLSGNTVATHIKSIYRKLRISSRTEASWYATMLGLAPGKTEGDETPPADPAAMGTIAALGGIGRREVTKRTEASGLAPAQLAVTRDIDGLSQVTPATLSAYADSTTGPPPVTKRKYTTRQAATASSACHDKPATRTGSPRGC